MKKYLIFVLTILAISTMAGVLYAEDDIYWDFSTPPDSTITEDDFSLDYKVRSSKSFGDQEIYDSFIPPEIDSPDTSGSEPVAAEPGAVPAPTAPIQSARPPVRSNVLPRDLSAPPTTRTTTRPAPPVTQTTPKPAETAPGTDVQSIVPRTETRTSIQSEKKRGTAAQAGENEADRPASKKMRWGQVDTQKSEPKVEEKSEQKFQWGRQGQ